MNLRALVFMIVAGQITSAFAAESTSVRPVSAVRQGPRILNPKERNIGRLIPDLTFQDQSGKERHLAEFSSQSAIVIAVTSTSCPLSKKYFPSLIELAKKYQKQNVAFLLVNPTSTDKPADISKDVARLGANGIYVHDKQGAFGDALGLTSTTDALVLDSARTVRYHGAVDDQYGFGYTVESPRKPYLINALDELLKGQPIVVTATEAPGCHLDFDTAPAAKTAWTYHNRISRIIQQNCVECHRDGGVAPFALDTRADLIAHSKMIQTVVSNRTMPPFFAEPVKDQPSPWINDCSLSDLDREDLLSWLRSDHPEGDPKDAPVSSSFASGWTIGKPNLVVKFPEAVPVQATGVMRYKNVVVESELTEDKWVQALEIRPGAPQVVHHILVFVRPPKTDSTAKRSNNPTDEINYWGIYVPGNNKQVYPEGFARKLPKGSQIRFQMHYTPNGTETTDTTEMAFVYADKEPQFEVNTTSLINAWFEIPPKADNFHDSAKVKLPADMTVLGFLPHMHLRGKACRYEMVSADGTRENLLEIPHYDFNWQLMYRYAEPRVFTKGTTLKFTAWFDNSDKNPANPDPNATVRWGEQTYDEMLLGYIEYYVPVPKSGSSRDQNEFAQIGLPADRDEMLFMSLDENDDNKLSMDEVKKLSQNPRFKQANPLMVGIFFSSLDKDRDGSLSMNEFKNIRELFNKKKK